MTKLSRLVLVMCLAGCAAPGPKYTLDDIANAQSAGRLEGLYETISQTVAQGKGGQELSSLLTEAGRRLADDQIKRFSTDLKQQRAERGAIALSALPSIDSIKAKLQRWNPSSAAQLDKLLAREIQHTRDFVARNRATLDGIKLQEPLKAIALARDNVYFTGSADDKSLLQTLSDQLVEYFYSRGGQKLLSGDFASALEDYKIAADIRPDYKDVADQVNRINAAVFSQQFVGLLEQGKADDAHAMFLKASDDPSFEQIKQELGSTVGIMRDFFSQMAEESSEHKEYYTAYLRFRQADEIMRLMEMQHEPPTKQKREFINFLLKLAEKVRKDGRPGVALGLAKVVEELSPIPEERARETKSSRQVRRVLRQAREEVETVAVKGISTSTFAHSAGQGNLGNAIASRITKYLFNEIPNDVRIVEREQLETLLREKKLKQQSAQQRLATTDYFIEGSILEAKVDSSVKDGSKTMRVVTGHNDTPNPEHEKWSKRKNGPEPARFIKTPITETVTVNIQSHRKVGLVSASFRLIAAESAKVVYTDTVSEDVVHNDQSSEGIQIGEFVAEHKFSELPSDVEILNGLSVSVSDEIGAKLVEALKDSESAYAKEAEALMQEGNIVDSAEFYAYALVMLESKKKDAEQVLTKLKDASVQGVSEIADTL
ncbi:hypothetical protein HBA55_30230 [Pseudomaricurvus alkylphenolicus]|uniref:CsgG/HfaB family protein n=1 Tax=Pseudomaricurvus alkylphenolicus TaxID=1306991 RepID=UPI0014227C44|nr:CsgG/HfaB family protein [Pseudomaricurvus alkylphenolicus]NIB43919.1 hypothetical protein [Pseudomaricurvus alkylphenolicus]